MPSSERPTIEETDVLVAGGGTAGVVAALQAARAGVRTTLIEWTGQLGRGRSPAALGVQQNHPSRDIPVREIRALLARHEAILPPLPGED